MSDVNALNEDLDPEMYDDIDVEALKVLRKSPIVDALLVELKRQMQSDRAWWQRELDTGGKNLSYARGRWDAGVRAYSSVETALNPEFDIWCDSCDTFEQQSLFASLIVPNSRDIS